MNRINFGIRSIVDDTFTISNVSKIVAYPSESELSIEKLSLNDHNSFKFFYSDYPDEQGLGHKKILILNACDIIYMKVTS